MQLRRLHLREILVEFVAYLGGAWTDLNQRLMLYYADAEQSELGWNQLRLDTIIDEIKQKV